MALPDAVVSTLFGIFDVMNAFALMGMSNAGLGARAPFHIEIVGEAVGPFELASGVPINVQRAIDTIETSDIVIVPSVLLRPEGWKKGRYPRLVDWLHAMHDRGAVLCSACSGIFLLAETGLFDGKDATVHFELRPGVRGRVSGRSDSSGARARDLRFARRAGELGRIDDLARPGAVPHRALRRRDRPRRKSRACSRCNGIRTGSRRTSFSKARATTATARSRARSSG